MRVAITGTSGRIGGAVLHRLRPHHEVVGLDRAPSPSTTHVGDIADATLLRRAFEGAEAVVHAAALHAPHVGVVPDDEIERVNVAGTRAVVDAAVAAGVRRIVYTSTTALYGGVAPGRCRWIDEHSEPRPRTVYHRTKLAAERVLEHAAERHGLEVRVLRMARCFPEPAPLMAVYRLHRGIDVRDVAAAHEAALANDGTVVQRHIVSGATPFRPEDATELADDAAGVIRRRAPGLAAAFERRGWALPSAIDRVYDATAAQRDLGWRPRLGFEEVLAALDGAGPDVLPPLRKG